MPGTVFYHPDIGTLNIRFAPTSVEWNFNLLTNTVPTYAGEVVQVLGINFDQLILEGQFGKEGPFGVVSQNGRLVKRPTSEYSDFNDTRAMAIGLTQMTEFFRRYFAIASQGHDAKAPGHYNQIPVTVRYYGSSSIGREVGQGEDWTVYPISFPSYQRSVENFAPNWRVVCQIHEAPEDVRLATQKDVITQLSETDKGAFRPGVGYRPFNVFSDPFDTSADPNAKNFENLSKSQQMALLAEAQKQVNTNADKLFDKWKSMLPAYTDDELNKLILIGGSAPAILDTTTQAPNKSG